MQKLVVPEGCKVTLPTGSFQPWEVYKVVKGSTPKIRTPGKNIAGGQTLNVTKVKEIRASYFRCEKAANEWRAQVKASAPAMVTLSLHDALTPMQITTQCVLSSISMYKSEIGIPGLRFDYGHCPLGPARKATLLMGLKKVAENWGATPNLRAFMEDVCDDAQNNKGDAQLRFDLVDIIQNARGYPDAAKSCFAYSADMTIMRSENNCFEPAMVWTFLDQNNHFPVFPVKDSEWDYFVANIPTMVKVSSGMTAIPQKTTISVKSQDPCAPVKQVEVPAPTPAPLPSNPCAPVIEPHPVTYSHIVQDRVCLAMPELNCNSDCTKVCKVTPTTVSTPGPDCKSCYDCENEDIIYAIFGTLLTFWICQTIYRNSVTKDLSEWYWTQRGAVAYNPLSSVRDTLPDAYVPAGWWGHAVFWYAVMAFIVSWIAYYGIVSYANYVFVVQWGGKEMCNKVWDWQTNLATGIEMGAVHWDLLTFMQYGDRRFACHNEICFNRLWGLVVTTWASLVFLFGYWRWFYISIETAQNEMKREETFIEVGGGGGMMAGGSAVGACTVQ
jgi:hypothetical protein